MTTRPEGAPARSSHEGSAGVSASVTSLAGAADDAVGVDAPGFSWRKLLWISWPLGILGLLIAYKVPLCPSKNLLGIPCPGCGLTRATLAMVVGDFGTMLVYHPLAPIITPFVVFSVIRAMLVSAGAIPTAERDPLAKLPKWVWPSVGISLVGLWVIRLAGGLGGLPDDVDPAGGLLYRAAHFVLHDAWL